MPASLCDINTFTYLLYITLLYLFNGPLSGTTWVSGYQKGKTNPDYWSKR